MEYKADCAARRSALLDNPVASDREQRCGDNLPCKTGAAFVGAEGHPPDGALYEINSYKQFGYGAVFLWVHPRQRETPGPGW